MQWHRHENACRLPVQVHERPNKTDTCGQSKKNRCGKARQIWTAHIVEFSTDCHFHTDWRMIIDIKCKCRVQLRPLSWQSMAVCARNQFIFMKMAIYYSTNRGSGFFRAKTRKVSICFCFSTSFCRHTLGSCNLRGICSDLVNYSFLALYALLYHPLPPRLPSARCNIYKYILWECVFFYGEPTS